MVFLAQDSWLSGFVAGGILPIVGAIAFFATRRWSWRAWPVLLIGTLIAPTLFIAMVLFLIYYIDYSYGLAGGFVIHSDWLALTVFGPAVAGSALGLAAHRRRKKVS